MKLRLYNTLSRQKEEFVPYDKNEVKMYTCGPTVYDYIHIGNARTIVLSDMLFRLLKQLYPNVISVRNVTDVDDKINARASERNISIEELTKQTYGYFQDDLKALNCLKPTVEPFVTDHMKEIIIFIQKLIEKKHAYVAENHVLFDVSSFPEYGKLSGRSKDDMIAGARVEVAPYKKNPEDFVLWKPSKEDEPYWESSWGNGRPGWHIECSVMSEKHLGKTFDIHAGGNDLIFPHHENEIAQSCACNGLNTYARFWFHGGMLNVDGKKMSKSLGNFHTAHEILEKYDGDVLRFYLLSAHYHQPMNFSFQGLDSAVKTLDRMRSHFKSSLRIQPDENNPDLDVIEALCDDLNTPKAFAILHKKISELSIEKDTEKLQILLQNIANTFAFFGIAVYNKEISIPQVVIDFAEKRLVARQNKDWEESDRLRSEIEKAGFSIKDTDNNYEITEKK